MASSVSSSTSSNAALFNSINGTSTSTSTSSSANQQASNADEMQTRFLNLLVTQLKNQDPLNPMDNAQMTTQLSQISTVSGIEKLNTTLQSLLSAYSGSQNMQAAAMIGKTVLTAGSALALDADGAIGGITLDAAADKVTVAVTDSAGNAVRTLSLGAQSAGTFNFAWDGKNDAGEAVTAGDYKFTVKATKGTTDVTSTALQAGTVSAVTISSDGLSLQLASGKSAAYSDVKQILN